MNASRLIALATLLLTLAGCKSGDLSMAPVSGTVRYQGQPLDHGQVVFLPDGDTPGPQAVGEIQADGTFRMQTLDRAGAVIGKHVVLVHCRAKLTPEQERALQIGKPLIPEKYGRADSTPLRFEVQPGENRLPIELE